VDEDWSDRPEPEFYAIYTSASWCAPCRRFTPSLVQSYNFLKPKYGDRFEMVLCSWDETKPAMLDYMKDEGMQWYGNWDNRKSGFWRKYQGDGIPCLVLVDREGYILSHSYTTEEYVGPDKALSDLTKLLVYTSTDRSSRVSVPPPGIDFGKLKVVIEKRQREARTGGNDIGVAIVHNPQGLLKNVVDAEGAETELRLKVTVTELGVAQNVSVVGNDNPDLNLQIQRALLLWQFLPAVASDGSVRSVDIVLPIRLKLKEAYLASAGN
jgi:thiol-disulfide isomerase/thioredoxin